MASKLKSRPKRKTKMNDLLKTIRTKKPTKKSVTFRWNQETIDALTTYCNQLTDFAEKNDKTITVKTHGMFNRIGEELMAEILDLKMKELLTQCKK